MADIYYSKEHEWVEVDGDVGTIGITDHAQNQLGDIVFVELPEVGNKYSQGDEAGVVESVKAASEIFVPVSGEVVEANGDLEDDFALVNSDAEGKAWFIKIKLSNKDELDGLMDKAAYDAFVKSES